jgi:hypothetical protein
MFNGTVLSRVKCTIINAKRVHEANSTATLLLRLQNISSLESWFVMVGGSSLEHWQALKHCRTFMLLQICLHHRTCWLNITSPHCRTCYRRWERGARGPWGKWGHLGCWRGWGTRPARQREERAVGIRQWRKLAILKMLEGTGDGLGTTSSHVYAQSTYHICIMCCNLLRFNNHNCELCFTVPICFRRINHMAVKKHLHSSSVVREVVSSTGLAY